MVYIKKIGYIINDLKKELHIGPYIHVFKKFMGPKNNKFSRKNHLYNQSS